MEDGLDCLECADLSLRVIVAHVETGLVIGDIFGVPIGWVEHFEQYSKKGYFSVDGGVGFECAHQVNHEVVALIGWYFVWNGKIL